MFVNVAQLLTSILQEMSCTLRLRINRSTKHECITLTSLTGKLVTDIREKWWTVVSCYLFTDTGSLPWEFSFCRSTIRINLWGLNDAVKSKRVKSSQCISVVFHCSEIAFPQCLGDPLAVSLNFKKLPPPQSGSRNKRSMLVSYDFVVSYFVSTLLTFRVSLFYCHDSVFVQTPAILALPSALTVYDNNCSRNKFRHPSGKKRISTQL